MMSSTQLDCNLKIPECHDINFDTPNRTDILKNGLRRASTENLLGRGTFGLVFKAIYKGEQVAVKIVNNVNNNMNRMEAVKNESNVLNWNHPNIVKIFHIEFTPTYSAIIMERFHGQCLQSIIDAVVLSLLHRFWISKDIIKGLNYCHKNNILHLDIKPQNVMVSFNSNIKLNVFQNFICKLCDFGSSRNICQENSSSSPGTIRYMSPEALKNENLTSASDIYSFGVTMWQLKSRCSPYFQIDCNDAVAYKVVKNELRPTTPTEEVDNCFQFNNPHHNCLCQHFSSETKIVSRKDVVNLDHIKSSPFKKLQSNSLKNDEHGQYVKKKSNKRLYFGLSVDCNIKTNSDFVNLDENFNNQQNGKLDLENIFSLGNNIDCGLKEQHYKNIYNKCWKNEPKERPSGALIEKQINKILNLAY